jgi:hemolysin activation/secretion protein
MDRHAPVTDQAAPRVSTVVTGKDVEAGVNSDGVSERATLHAHRGRWSRLRVKSRSRWGEARAWRVAGCCLILCAIGTGSAAAKSESDAVPARKPVAAKPENTDKANSNTAKPASGGSGSSARFDIDEFRIEGADSLPQIEVEAAVYPFLGPKRTADDVEKARAAVEKAYHDKGLQTVGVAVPQQDAQRGFIVLKVTENRVGRLRVKGSRYFDLANVKSSAPSLKEGSLPNFKEVTKDIVSLNRWPDRRVTPALRAGIAPGTIDVDLNVEDTLPLHASAELNNRQSPSTTSLRESYSLRYDNLWQLGHSMTVTYQDAPLNRKDAMVISGSYMARTPVDWLNVLLYGLKSDSAVATVGGANVIGPGEVIGGRAVLTLPTKGELFHTLSLGIDYKHFAQTLKLGSDAFDSPVTYAPLVASYGATWQGDGRLTQLNASITTGLRGIGSSPEEFDAKRFKATGSFIHLNADVSHTQDVAYGVQLFAKLQGQVADQPLISSEQFSIGGQDTVRGYLESEVLGDYGVVGTVELRSPNLAPHFEQKLDNPLGQPVKFNAFDDWRFFAFADAGHARIHEPLPEQKSQFDLASYGIGTRVKTLKHFNGVFLVGVPAISQQATVANHPRFSFRVWGEF